MISTEVRTLTSSWLLKVKIIDSVHLIVILITGVSWFVRQMIKLAKVSKVLAKNETPGKYNMENLTSKKNTLYHGWELGKTFEAEGLDGVAHKVSKNIQVS